MNTPKFTICCATILDTGSEEQKRQHISVTLRGDEVPVQLLSEPSGGSDLAGVITRAERRGDNWIINGAKTWSTGAFVADYGPLLAHKLERAKHEGLTMFLAPLDSPGIMLRRIKQINGSTEFCGQFFDDLELGDDAVVGEIDKGWDVASRRLYHERRAVGGGSEFASGSGAENNQEQTPNYRAMIRAASLADNERAHELAGRALTRRAVRELADRPRLPLRAGRVGGLDVGRRALPVATDRSARRRHDERTLGAARNVHHERVSATTQTAIYNRRILQGH